MHQVSLHKITSLVCRENNYKLYYLFSREIWRERERKRESSSDENFIIYQIIYFFHVSNV